MSFDFAMKAAGTADLIRQLEGMADGLGTAEWVVGTNVKYAVHLEQGTSKMPAYPFMRPAVESVMGSKADGIADDADSVDGLVKQLAIEIEAEAKRFATTGVPPGPDVDTNTLRSSIKAEKV